VIGAGIDRLEIALFNIIIARFGEGRNLVRKRKVFVTDKTKVVSKVVMLSEELCTLFCQDGLVDQHFALQDRTVCGFRRSNCQPSAIERFR